MTQKQFAQSLPPNVFEYLAKVAKERGVPSVQELLRNVVIPEWIASKAKKP